MVGSTASNPAVADGLAVSVQGLSHSFALGDQHLPVLDHVDLDLRPGNFVAILGPSGCGKSTLLRLAAGLERPAAGRITADGRTINDPDPERVLVFQDPTLYPWRTVRANVGLGLEARGLLRTQRHRIDEALQLVGLEGFKEAYPHQLSGGMAQRASLARALVNDPRLLLLDEPLGKLDSLTRLSMQSELVRLWQEKGFTALLVTHDVEEAIFMAERIVVMSPRPARILDEIVNDLPYPRHRGDERMHGLRRRALALLGLDASW
ncbi:NitT/TauT family transport system ATP-binding protein [Arboricoccus pini]|uniref:NitT/TauT family transport system ATP-binding protein n=1 Tax=Arboricoccus pini TaxID=1963835 RepID=A0A212RQR8_9PROT|nr:ABC transporter ATP-binding protein [Arboricoccus pini]SNB74931.1 NitT/TauT family transport system ATP-binding protein [Arboricoccus pini]